MGTSYSGKKIKNTFGSIIKVSDNSNLTAFEKQLSDGLGNDIGLFVGTNSRLGIGITPTEALHVSGNFNLTGEISSTGNRILLTNSSDPELFLRKSVGGDSIKIKVNGSTQAGNNALDSKVDFDFLHDNVRIFGYNGSTLKSFVNIDAQANSIITTGVVSFGSLTDSGESITITKFVDEADGISNNDNDTTLPTSAAVKDFVDSQITAEDLDFSDGSTAGSVDLNSQTFVIQGTANEVETSASSQTLTIGLPNSVSIASTLGVGVTATRTLSVSNRLNIVSANDANANLLFGDTDDDSIGQIKYNNATNTMELQVNNSVAQTINSSGNTTFAGSATIGSSTTPTSKLLLEDSSSDSIVQIGFKNDAREYRLGVHGGLSDSFILFDNTASTTRLTIDSSGNTTFAGNVAISNANGQIDFDSGNGNIQTTTGSTSLVFGVNSSEKLRIHSTGKIQAQTSGGYFLTENTTDSFSIKSNGANGTLTIRDEFNSADRLTISNAGATNISGTLATASAGNTLTVSSTSGSAAIIDIGRTADTTAKIKSGDTAAGDLTFFTGGSRRLTIDSAGDFTFAGSTTIRKSALGGSTAMSDGTIILGAGSTNYYALRLDSSADLHLDRSFGGSNSTVLSVDRSSGNVGIGVFPVAKFHVSGDTGGTDSIARFQNTNSAKVTKIQLSDNAGTVGDVLIAYDHSDASSANHFVGMGVNNNTAFKIDNNDNATFAGATSTFGSTSLTATNNYVLDVKKAYSSGNGHVAYFGSGTLTAAKNDFDTVVVAQDDVPCLAIIEGNTAANTHANEQSLRLAVGDNNAVISTGNTSGGLHFFVNRGTNASGFATNSGTKALHLLNNGNAIFDNNLGIGTSTPARPLSVNSSQISARFTSSSADSQIEIVDSSGTVVFGSSSGNAIIQAGSAERMRISSAGDIAIGTTTAASVRTFIKGKDDSSSNFQILTRNSSDENIFAVNNAGSVGIGTSSPGSIKLHVSGSGDLLKLTSTNSGNAGAQLDLTHESASPADNDIVGLINFTGLDSGDNNTTFGSIRCFATSVSSETGDFVFITRTSSSSFTEKMRINSSGDILFGTTSETNTHAYFSAESNNRMVLSLGSSTTASQVLVAFKDSTNGTIGNVTSNAGGVSFNSISDYRLKENIIGMTNALDRVSQLKPSQYNLKKHKDNTVEGFIAHELQEVYPQAVSGEKDKVNDKGEPEYQFVDNSKLVPLLVGAIQELKKEIEILKNK